MDWTKHGTAPVSDNDQPQVGTRRVAVPVTPQLHALIGKFKQTYPTVQYSDAAVLKTLVEAGARAWITDISNQANDQTETSTPNE